MDTNTPSGRIIMFDGPDGVGKTTQISLLADAYKAAGLTVLVSRVPGGTPIGEALREVSLNKELARTALTDLYISLAYHATLADQLQSQRQSGTICLMDRSPLSIIAYQSAASGLALDVVRPEVDKVLSWYQPDAIVYLKASSNTLVERRMKHTKKDYFESKGESYMSSVQAGYDNVADMYGCRIVRADGTEEEVNTLLLDSLSDLIRQ